MSDTPTGAYLYATDSWWWWGQYLEMWPLWIQDAVDSRRLCGSLCRGRQDIPCAIKAQTPPV